MSLFFRFRSFSVLTSLKNSSAHLSLILVPSQCILKHVPHQCYLKLTTTSARGSQLFSWEMVSSLISGLTQAIASIALSLFSYTAVACASSAHQVLLIAKRKNNVVEIIVDILLKITELISKASSFIL